jgi:hypothetical protein
MPSSWGGQSKSCWEMDAMSLASNVELSSRRHSTDKHSSCLNLRQLLSRPESL